MEIEKTENPDVPAEVSIDTPFTGASESFADVPAGEQTPESIAQEVASVGGGVDQQRVDDVDPDGDLAQDAGMAPEGDDPAVNEDSVVSDSGDPVANETTEQESFWSGFFGKPKIPRVGG